ncbi:Transcriptional regulator (TetR-like) [Methanocella conradii HZ254]|uniref:Transcriptional regulator (TetR-like) n=2 Tax=Methanocella TaxID=570266 RepID=H8I6B7_METCZ|nr:Transcriptional regulator (TetR-like) [Methanocella conradii HZ254]
MVMCVTVKRKSGRPAKVPGEKGTKERIFDTAIDLFAERGYDGVSIRDIAAAVGIKESSIYKHYTGKEEILDSIFEYFLEAWRQSVAGKWSVSSEAEEQVVSMGLDGFMAMASGVFTSWLGDPRMEKIMRVSFIELYHNEKIRKSQLAFLDAGYAFFESSFAIMIKHKLIKPIDPKVLAMEYMSFYMNALVDYFIMRYGTMSGSFLQEYGARIKEHTAFITNSIKP